MKKYLGIELGGSKGNRTSLVSLDYFSEERKVLVSGLSAQISTEENENSDQRLIALVKESKASSIGINAPLSMPPCITCTKPICPGFEVCDVPSVKWMREEIRTSGLKISTPYTQRPVDLLLRGRWQKEKSFIPADETLGAGRAPLAARMHYLKRHLAPSLFEVYPRMALVGISSWFRISDRELRLCRDVEVGVDNRFSILEKLGTDLRDLGIPHLYLYNADLLTFAKELSAFDALLCGLMALYQDLQFLEEPIVDREWGYITKPKAELFAGGR